MKRLSLNISKLKIFDNLDVNNINILIFEIQNENAHNFTILSKYLSQIKNSSFSNLNEIHLSISDDVNNIDNKALSLLVLFTKFLIKSKNIEVLLCVDYNESAKDIVRNSRFYRLLNVLSRNESCNEGKEKYLFEINNKSKYQGFSNRCLPFFQIDTANFRDLFVNEIKYLKNEYIINMKLDYTITKGSNIFEKNWKFILDSIEVKNISHIEFLLIQYEAIFNYSSITNFFTNYSEYQVKRYYPKSSSKGNYSGIANVANQFIKDKISSWSYCKLSLFLIFYINDFLESRSNEVLDISSFRIKVRKIESITDSIYNLLYESSKNIIEHSSSKMGIISVRISSNIQTQIDTSIIERNNSTSELSNLLQVSILDLSEIGVKETFKINIDKLLTETNDDEAIEVLNRDLKSLDDLSFKDFLFSLDKNIIHQNIRSIAHYGLPILSNIIIQNKMLLAYSTPGSSDKIDFGYMSFQEETNNFNEHTLNANWYNLGTGYEIIYDLNDKDKLYSKYTIDSKNWNKETNNIKNSIVLLQNLNHINLNKINESKINITDNTLLHYECKTIEEITNKFQNFTIEFDCVIFLSLKCDEISNEIDRSIFYRKLSKINQVVRVKNLILTDVNFNVIIGLENLVFKILNKGWNSDTSILVFYEEENLICTSIFGGNTLSDSFTLLEALNESFIVGHHTKTIIDELRKTESIIPIKNAFYHNGQLLPFDLILDSKENIFLENIKSILNFSVSNE